jgi:putative FmdB family regulatory protein
VPIYEYGCESCGTIEVTQRITDKPLRRCPNCKGKVSKLISATSFQLKGSGWYVTDYAGKDGKKSKDESKSESKPESTPPSKETKESSSKADGKGEATAA